MIPVKNRSRGRKLRMCRDDDRFMDCWLCGKPQREADCTSMMHPACWEQASQVQKEQAERDLDYGNAHDLEYVLQGCGGVKCV